MIAVVLPTKDEALRLRGCVESVEGIGRTYVVDTGSTDGTRQIAHACADEVWVAPYRHSASLKNRVLDALPRDTQWVLFVDADEEVPPTLSREIRHAVESATPEVAGFVLRRRNFVAARAVRGGGWWPDPNVRLVRYGRARFEGRAVHAELEVDGELRVLDTPILHHARDSFDDHFRHVVAYALLEAEELRSSGGGPRRLPLRSVPRVLRPPLRLVWRFIPCRPLARIFWDFVVRSGWRDGWMGWNLAVMEGAYQAYAEAVLALSSPEGGGRESV